MLDIIALGFQTDKTRVASLLLAQREKGELVYKGNVGTGFDTETMADLAKRFAQLKRKTAPLEVDAATAEIRVRRMLAVCAGADGGLDAGGDPDGAVLSLSPERFVRISEGQVRRTMVASLVDSIFGGDPKALVAHLVSEADVAPGDLERIRRMLAKGSK